MKNNKPFYNSTIPIDWDVKSIEQLGEILSGLTYSPKDIRANGTLVLRSSNIQDGTLCFDDNVYVGIDKKNYNPVLENDILICVRNGSKSLIGKNALITADVENCAFGAFMAVIRSKYNNYLFHLLNTDFFKREVHRNLGATINSINGNNLKKFKFPLPPISEQKAIADILGTLDSVIIKTSQLISQKEFRKKWLMQNLLTGKKRLKGFSGEWKTHRLKNVLVPASRPVDKPGEAFLALGIRSHGKGTFLKPDFEPEKIAMDTLYEVKENDLIVNITFAWEGAIAIVKSEDDGALVSHRFPTFNFNSKTGVVDYFRHLILQPRFRYMLDLISPGGAGRNRVLSKKDFLKLEVTIPEVEEQTAIAKVLQTADKEIELLKAKTDKLREQKKGMMQVLLTGKKRLKVEKE